MDIETKIDLICRLPTEEVLTIEDLRNLLETEEHPIAYNGWEPSGLVHLGTGVICAYKMKDFLEAGIRFKAYLSTWHAWLNNKLGGNLELIRKAADLFKHSWIALGVPEDEVTRAIPFEHLNLCLNRFKYFKYLKFLTPLNVSLSI